MRILRTRTRGCFGVGKGIKYLDDIAGVGAFNLDGMRRELSIKSKGALKMVRNEFRVGFPLGKDPFGNNLNMGLYLIDEAHLSELVVSEVQLVKRTIHLR